MKSKGKQSTWVQCQSCGNIYQIADKVSIEKSIIQSVCPRCGGNIGLNCGDKEEDIYIYMNPNLDERYYIY
jgi:predicted  nucleic acid-binding Zn-ribbon protein